MKVSLLDPARCNLSFLEELQDAANRIITSGQFILGEEVEKFETACAEYLGVKHAIGVSSGTDALLLALMALDIGPGDEVICPSFTFFATASCIARVGATPVFVDNLPGCFTCDIESVKRAITVCTKAIIPVHLFGQCADMDAIMALAHDSTGIAVIEDACQAIGATLGNKHAGDIGDIGCFSFFPSKNLGGFGDAGLVTTNSDPLAYEMRALRVHGGRKRYYYDCIGGNFRIDAIQAAMLAVKLKHLPELEKKRIEHANLYQEMLKHTSYILPSEERGKHVYNQFTIRVSDGGRDALCSYLQDRGIATGIYYPLPIHQQKCFQNVVFEDTHLPEAIRASSECLSLPIASELTKEEIQYVALHLIDF